jgi:transposase
MNVRYRVTLREDERTTLHALVTRGQARARVIKRAQILLAAAAGATEAQIATTLHTGPATIYRLKRAFVEEGLDAALYDAHRPGAPRKLTSPQVALLVATACSAHPPGRNGWTMELLADEMVRLTEHAHLGRETVRRRLAENDLKPWQQKMWNVPLVNSTYVARMEDVLELYAEPPDPKRPAVSFDESPVQLIGETRDPQPAVPGTPATVTTPAVRGTPARLDFEYVRNGTANLFVMMDVHHPWRHVKVTAQRTNVDFAVCMQELVDVHYPDADCIRVVLDNLSTHSEAALYDAFEPAEARRILRKLEFHYTPKHASWLNMVEIEIGVLKAQCLDRRIPDVATLRTEIAAWEKARNDAGARIRWLFTVERAREKLGRVYRPLEAARKAALDAA